MVSYSNIPSALLVLSLFLLLSPPFNFHKPRNLVAADYQLILAECQQSTDQTTCINCLKSDPAAGKADKTGLAAIALNCVSNHGNNLVAHMGSLASKTEDPNLKAIYQDCVNKYSMNKNVLASVQQALKNHEYLKADLTLSDAFRPGYACYASIDKHLSQVPASVTNEINLYLELTLDAHRIIEELRRYSV